MITVLIEYLTAHFVLAYTNYFGTILIDISMGQFPTQHGQKSRIPATKATIYA